MSREVITFGDIEIEKHNCYFLNNVDIDNKLIADKFFSSEENYKYFIGYTDVDNKIKPFSIVPSKTSAHVKSYDSKTK